jgi:hypothetical protein
VVRNSEGFIRGLTNIKGVCEELNSIKEACRDSKLGVGHLKEAIVLNAARATVLKRKRNRLLAARNIIT